MKSLIDLPTGAEGVVRQLRGGRDFISRMAALGFNVGTSVEVVQNYGRGPLIVRVLGARVALGRGEAQKILVESRITEGDTDEARSI